MKRKAVTIVLTGLLTVASWAIGSAGGAGPTVAAERQAPTTAPPTTVVEEEPLAYRFPDWTETLNTRQHGWLTAEGARCWESIARLQSFAQALGVPLVCEETERGGGIYNGVAVVKVTEDYVEPDYYLEVAAHELGHAWDFTRFNEWDRKMVATALGWESFDVEAWADIFSQGIGCWRDQGTGWRQAYGFATADQLETLRIVGLLPDVWECRDLPI